MPPLTWRAASARGSSCPHRSDYGSFGSASALLYPVFTLLFAAVSAMSLVDALRPTPIKWRGRNIEVPR